MNFPSIPNGLNQILLVLIVVAFFYTYKNTYEEKDAIKTEERIVADTTNTLKLLSDSMKAAIIKEKITKKIARILDQYNHHTFNKTAASTGKIQHTVDSLSEAEYDADLDLLFASEKLKKYRNKVDLLNVQYQDASSVDTYVNIFLVELGFLFLLILDSIAKGEKKNDEIKRMQVIQLHKSTGFTRCQSCAKVFSPLLSHGKETDGTANEGFCTECYNEGKFTHLTLTSNEVIDNLMNSKFGKSDNKFRERIHSWLFPRKKIISKYVHKMTRWNSDPYNNPFDE
jgi:hypothetical protein